MKRFREFLSEAMVSRTNKTTFSIYSSGKSRFPRTIIAPWPPATGLMGAGEYLMVELPLLKLTLPRDRDITGDVPYYRIPTLIQDFIANPSQHAEELDRSLKAEGYKPKFKKITRKQLVAFFIKKQISLVSLSKFFGDLSFDIHDISAADIAATPVRATATKTKATGAGKKTTKPVTDIPEKIPPFTIVYPPRYKDKLGLSKLVKVATVLLRKHDIAHLFDHVIIVFAGIKRNAAGTSLGSNVIQIDPARGYDGTTLTTIMHELWHWLEEKYPDLIRQMTEKRQELSRVRSADTSHPMVHRLSNVINPTTLVGKKISMIVKGRDTPATGVIQKWEPGREAFIVAIDPEHISHTKKSGKIGNLKPSIYVAGEQLLKGWSHIIGGPDVHKLSQSHWTTTKYAQTNAREFGAEMFAYWSTGRLTGEPAEFMSDLLSSVRPNR
jgi:hypothetical protein